MKKYLSPVVFLLACLACSPGDADPQSVYLSADCAYEPRKTTSTITLAKGTVRVTPAGAQTWTDIYLDGDTSTPYCACNLPASFSTEGTRIVFSAEVKETYPTERWRCQPIKLTALFSGGERKK